MGNMFRWRGAGSAALKGRERLRIHCADIVDNTPDTTNHTHVGRSRVTMVPRPTASNTGWSMRKDLVDVQP